MICAAYAYVLFPCMIFLIGWVKWYISLPVVLLMCVGMFHMRKDFPAQWHFKTGKQTIGKLILIVGIVTIWVSLSGIGKLVYQNSDHSARNTIFEILVNYDWPVAGKVLLQDGQSTVNGLIYYIGFWMPAALVGKVFGLTAGYCFQMFWAILGVLLFYYLVCLITQKLAVWPLLVFMLFSGLDALGDLMVRGDMQRILSNKHIEWWMSEYGYQFSGFTTQLFWVFNQAIPSWVVLGLLMVQNKNRHVALIMSTAMLSSTFPFVGMIPFAVYYVMSRTYRDTKKFSGEWWKAWIKDTFRVENITGIAAAFLFLFYLTGNRSANQTGMVVAVKDVRGYLLFMILEVGIYYLLLFRGEKKNPLYIISLLWLCICPMIYVGSGSDFCMRASIPALIVLYLMVIREIRESYQQKKILILVGLFLTIGIGSITSIHEIGRTVECTAKAVTSAQSYAIVNWSEEQVFAHQNFAGDVEDSLFYRYLARDIEDYENE